MKKKFIPMLIIFVFLIGLLVVSVSTGIPKSFWKIQKQEDDSLLESKPKEIVSGQEVTTTQKPDSKERYSQISQEEVEFLLLQLSQGKASVFTVPIKDLEDISQIKKTRVIIMTQEPDYVVLIGDEKRIEAVKSLGFTLREPVETDHKKRPIRVWITDKEQLDLLHFSDIWPIEHIPGYVYGGAYDYEIQLLRDQGYDVKLGHK